MAAVDDQIGWNDRCRVNCGQGGSSASSSNASRAIYHHHHVGDLATPAASGWVRVGKDPLVAGSLNPDGAAFAATGHPSYDRDASFTTSPAKFL